MSLTEAPIDKKLLISDILSGTEVRRKLSSLGIHINDCVIKVNSTKWGPILLQNLSSGTSKVAIGRGLAEKILVDYDN
jgi:Fe2+ transport system protein FeoA